MKVPAILVPLLLLGGSIAVGTVLTILNAVVYIDPAVVFAVMFIAILAAWSVLNRWEGECQLRRITSGSSKLTPDAPEQERRNPE